MPENVPELVSSHTSKDLLEIHETYVLGCFICSSVLCSMRMKLCSVVALSLQQAAFLAVISSYLLPLSSSGAFCRRVCMVLKVRIFLSSCHKQPDHLSWVFWPRGLSSSQMVLYTDQESDCSYSEAGPGQLEGWLLHFDSLTKSNGSANIIRGHVLTHNSRISNEEAYFLRKGSFLLRRGYLKELRLRLISTEEEHCYRKGSFFSGGSFLKRWLIATEEAFLYKGILFLQSPREEAYFHREGLFPKEEAYFYTVGSFLQRKLISTEDAHMEEAYFLRGGSFLQGRLLSTKEAYFYRAGEFVTDDSHFYKGA